MSLKGVKIGLDLQVSKLLQNELFVRGDFRYAFGSVDYNSINTGSASGEPDWYIEARGLIGHDWQINETVLAGYIGAGFRYLFNDGRGITNTGFGGYRRESNYFYLPIGLKHRRGLNNQAILESTLEFDPLLFGTQYSYFSDVGIGLGDMTNNQSSGFGLKLNVVYQKNIWAIGPYMDYWNVGQSDMTIVYQNGTPVGMGYEPKNNTVEFGLKASQLF